MNFYEKKKKEEDRAYQFLASRGKKKSAFSQIPPFLSKTGVWREEAGGGLCSQSPNMTNFSLAHRMQACCLADPFIITDRRKGRDLNTVWLTQVLLGVSLFPFTEFP